MGSLVSLVRSGRAPEAIKNAVENAIKLIEYKPSSKVRTVVIKPNLCYYWAASTGYTTDPVIVAVLIDWVRENYGRDIDIKIAEADASAMRTKYAFKILGYEKLAQEKHVALHNLSTNGIVKKAFKINGVKLSFDVPEILLRSDLTINVPKLKIMKSTKITCAMKNIFGANGFPRKLKYHRNLAEAIVGMNMAVPTHLTVVDGLVCLGTCSKRLNLIMAGTDGFSIDWIAAKIAGYNSSNLKFLQLAMKEKLGSIDGIMTRGEKLEDIAKVFPNERFIATEHLWAAQFLLMKVYKKLSGDVIPPVFEE